MIPESKLGSKLKVQILAGGISHERDISLKSARRVADALGEVGVSSVIREPDYDLLQNIQIDKPDVIWPVLHGSTGEDGALRDILALTGIPYVGATSKGARLAWDKSIAKALVSREGVQTPPSVTLPKDIFKELDVDSILTAVTNNLTVPLVVKPARSGSAHGVTVVEEARHLSRALVDAYVYCDVVIIEKFIEGTELAITVIDLGAGEIALPAVEIQPVDGKFGFNERYTAGETNYFVPARIPDKVANRAAAVAIKAHEVLGLRHLSRVDVIVDNDGTPWFLEANVVPGLTETSLVPQAIAASGNSLGDVYYSLVQTAHRGR
jgi:D-alanine-D-alanine ligase